MYDGCHDRQWMKSPCSSLLGLSIDEDLHFASDDSCKSSLPSVELRISLLFLLCYCEMLNLNLILCVQFQIKKQEGKFK